MNTPTVDEIADLVRVAYNAAYYRDMSTHSARNVAGEILSKPVGGGYMPHYLKEWLRTRKPPITYEPCLWLRQYL